MWIVELETNVVHDMSRPQYECQISKISKDKRKKIYTLDGVKRFLADPVNKGATGCRYCMPDFFDFDMTKIFQNNA